VTTQELNEEFEINRSKLRSFVFRLTTNKADTDDIVQDTYIKASTKLETFKGASSLKTWIFSIAANLAKDHLRSKKRWPSYAMDLAKAETLRDPGEISFKISNDSMDTKWGIRAEGTYQLLLPHASAKTLPGRSTGLILLKKCMDLKSWRSQKIPARQRACETCIARRKER